MARVPPQYVNVPSAVVYAGGLSAPLFQAYVMLRGLAWENDYRETPVVTLDELAQMLGCSDRSLRGYLAELEREGRIQVRRRGTRRVVIRFPDPPGTEEPPTAGETTPADTVPVSPGMPTGRVAGMLLLAAVTLAVWLLATARPRGGEQ